MELIYVEWKIDDQAQRCFNAAVAGEPKLAIAYARLGQTYARKGDVERARGYFQQALDRDPEDADALMGLAGLIEASGDRPKALELYQKAAAAWPESPEPALTAAKLLEGRNDPGAAEAFYRQAAQRSPQSVAVRRTLGALLAQQGRLQEARDVYEEARSIDPKHFPTLLALAKISEDMGDADGAFAYYRQAGEAKGDHPDVLRALGRGYLAREQMSGAEKAFAKLLELVADDAEAHLALARINADASRYTEAVEHYRAALLKQPDDKAERERKKLEEQLNIATTPAKGRTVDLTFGAALKPIIDLYKQRLKKRPKLEGKVTLDVGVNADGSVDTVTVKEDTLKDEYLRASIFWNIKDARFPTGEKKRFFTYPIEFSK